MSTDPDKLATFTGDERLTVPLGEYDTGWHDPVQSLARAREVAQHARAAGADLLIPPEMCATGFTMDADKFAEPSDGPTVRALSALAAEHRWFRHHCPLPASDTGTFSPGRGQSRISAL
ncbi:MAG TPA: nitrilase-related carbon-nitrogen hydrolase [Gemmatimonadaceae bacterium]